MLQILTISFYDAVCNIYNIAVYNVDTAWTERSNFKNL